MFASCVSVGWVSVLGLMWFLLFDFEYVCFDFRCLFGFKVRWFTAYFGLFQVLASGVFVWVVLFV